MKRLVILVAIALAMAVYQYGSMDNVYAHIDVLRGAL